MDLLKLYYKGEVIQRVRCPIAACTTISISFEPRHRVRIGGRLYRRVGPYFTEISDEDGREASTGITLKRVLTWGERWDSLCGSLWKTEANS